MTGTPAVRPLRQVAARVAYLALGALLVCAAALKAKQLIANPSAADAVIESWQVQLVAVNIEFALGLWLWSGAYAAAARRVAIITFTGFAVVSLFNVIHGKSSCGCFGAMEVAPWVMAVIDTLGVMACWTFRPAPAAAHVGNWRVALAGGVVIAVGVPVNSKILQGASAPPLLVSPGRLDMGFVGRGRASSAAFELYNPGGMEVEIDSVETSCSCASVRLPRRTLSPGERLHMTLNLNMGAEPAFQGGLRIKILGRTQEGRILFATAADAMVH